MTYYFPPSGGAGVQRPAKWAKYLRQLGVEPVVLTVREGAYPHRDEAMVADVAGLEVVRTRAPDPFGLYGTLTGRSRDEAVADRSGRVGESAAVAERVSRWIRGNVFVPDARVGWIPFAIARARRMHRAAPFDAVLTTGPPHSVHLIGRHLQRALGVAWVADFRDPWTEIHYVDALRRGRLASRLDRRLEQSVLDRADALLTVSEPLRAALADRARGTVHVVRNGFDPDDVAGSPPLPDTSRFTIAYVGTLYGVPSSLLDAIATCRRAGCDRMHLTVVGAVPPAFARAVEDRELAEAVRVRPPVAHDEAVRVMRSASLLVLTIETSWSYASGVVPGKTYEYLAVGRPVLGLGPEGDAADILRATGAGDMLDPDATEAIVSQLADHYRAWERGTPREGARPEAIASYSRRAQAQQVVDVLAALTPSA